MEKLSSKCKEYEKYQEAINTLIKQLMMLHLQNNAISFTLKNILSFEIKND